jgi:hypothetical protein
VNFRLARGARRLQFGIRVTDRREFTRLLGSLRSPNTIASAGHVAWQAVTISPSRIWRSSFFASIRAWLMRCTQ